MFLRCHQYLLTFFVRLIHFFLDVLLTSFLEEAKREYINVLCRVLKKLMRVPLYSFLRPFLLLLDSSFMVRKINGREKRRRRE